MGSNVRSVTVRLNAAVVGYIRDVNQAGDATEKAFDRVHTSTARAREDFVATDRAAQRLSTSTQGLGRSARLASPSQKQLATDVDRVSIAAVRGSASIDRYSGRMRILGELLATLGPGLLPIGAGGLAALAGLAGLFGGATVGALGLVAAVQGVGDALQAVEKARLDPTVENLQAAEVAMSRIVPEAREFVTRFQELRPVLKSLRDAGAEQFFPGLTDSLDSLERLAPTLRELLAVSGRAGGDAIARGADSLTTDRWAPFFEFLTGEIPDAIDDASRLVGSLAHGATEMWMAFDPTNDKFIDWLVDVGDGFDRWASSADGREDIQGFLDFVEKTGPKVGDFIVGAADAFTEMSQAAAPLSGPVLDGMTALLKVVAALADSDLGTPILAGVAALTLYTRGLQAATALQTKLMGTGAAGMGGRGAVGSLQTGLQAARGTAQQLRSDLAVLGPSYAAVATKGERAAVAAKSLRTNLGGMAKGTALVGGLAIAATGAADGIGLTNTASLALMGSIGGPFGVAIGGGVGAVMDLAAANNELEDAIRSATAAMKSGEIAAMEAQLENLESTLDANSSGFARFADAVDGIFSGLTGQGWDSAISDAGVKIQDLREELALTKQLTSEGWDGTGLQQSLLGPLADTAEQAHRAARGLEDLHDEYVKILGLLSKQGAWDAYQESIDNVTESIKENGRTLDSNTRAGRDNRAALNDLAEQAITFSEHLTGLDRIDFLTSARASFKKAAEDAGGLDRRTRDVLAAFDELVGKNAKPKIDDSDVRGAQEKAQGLLGTIDKVDGSEANPWVKLYGVPAAQSQLANLTKPRTVAIRAFFTAPKGSPVRPGYNATADPWQAPLQEADGGPIRGPGGPRDDAIAAYLSNGEYVIQAKAVDRYGVGLFDRLNAMKFAAGGPVGYAGGGSVRSSSGRDADNVVGGLRGMSRELRAAEKAIASERKQRESLVGRRNNLSSSVRDGLSEDIWRPGNDWTSGGPNSDLRGNIAEIRAFDKLTGRLKKKGLKGGALDAILAQGDLATAQSYAGMSKSDLAEYQRLYNVQRRELNRVSGNAGDAAYGAAIRESVREERRAVAELKQIRSAVNRGNRSNRDEQAKNRAAARKGAGDAARRKSRGYL